MQPGGLEADLIVDRDTRIAPGAHRDSDRQRARRCLRPGAGLEHLQSLQPAAISRGHGGGARILAEPGRAEGAVRQHLRRRGERHAGHSGRGGHHANRRRRARVRPRPRPRSPRTSRAISRPIRWRTAARGNTSTGSAVSVAQETVVPYRGLQPFPHQHDAGQRQSHRHLGLDVDRVQSAGRRIARHGAQPPSSAR